jgi:hypothetical protein
MSFESACHHLANLTPYWAIRVEQQPTIPFFARAAFLSGEVCSLASAGDIGSDFRTGPD